MFILCCDKQGIVLVPFFYGHFRTIYSCDKQNNFSLNVIDSICIFYLDLVYQLTEGQNINIFKQTVLKKKSCCKLTIQGSYGLNMTSFSLH
jgi:hypothetical protein